MIEEKCELCEARSLVCNLIPRLEWRHSGLGMLQAYVREGGCEEMRIHVWHPSLKLKGIEFRGLSHDHRFDMRSWLLVGELHHVDVQTVPDSEGDFHVYEVVNARKALRETGTLAGEFRLCPNAFNITRTIRHFSTGKVYSLRKRMFHESYPVSEMVITVVMKTNQDEVPARILSSTRHSPLNAFSLPIDKDECAKLLTEAQEALLRENCSSACSTDITDRRRQVVLSQFGEQFTSSPADFIERVLRDLRRASDCLK